MHTVGSFEAKTHLAALLDRVEKGEEIIITRRGKSVARLVPETKKSKAELHDIVERFRKMRKGSSLGGASWKELRDEGRR